jgi:hypothetical protein
VHIKHAEISLTLRVNRDAVEQVSRELLQAIQIIETEHKLFRCKIEARRGMQGKAPPEL